MNIRSTLQTIINSARTRLPRAPKRKSQVSGRFRVAESVSFRSLRAITHRPRPFESERRQFWADPHISGQVLNSHLDETSDAGTRRTETVQRSAGWIAEKWEEHGSGPPKTPVIPEEAPALLDLGCGPGLYALEFQHLGFRVTGVDIAPSALEYARSVCRLSDRHALFLQGDYLDMRFSGTYELITCIYGGMATISDRTQRTLLGNIYRSLVPGGLFMFDVLTRTYVDNERIKDGWFVLNSGGFWSPKPYLVLEKSYLFESHSACADSYSLLFSDGTADRYLVWHRYYTQTEIRQACESAGFEVISLYSDLCGTPQYSGSPWLGVIARKPTTAGDT